MPSRVHTPKVGIALNHLMPIHPHTWIKKTDRYYYNLATAFAKEKHWDDIILLNKNGMICESTISNIFIKNKNTYYTPSLDQGCVAGIYRHRFITECKTKGIEVVEKPLSIQDLQAAESVYLCNAVRKLYPIRLMASAGSDRMDITGSPLTQTQFPFE